MNTELDKSINASVPGGYGEIVVRVVVLEKTTESDSEERLLDAEQDEPVLDKGKLPTSSYLEDPKRGRLCGVFLVNGQRQHAWDNTFIVRDLGFKYLRNRMVVIVDVDRLKPTTIAKLMQGSRHGFYEGEVFSTLTSRVIAALKGDPDLERLEAEAEDEVSSLRAGDEAVRQALDQLIEEHSNAALRAMAGNSQNGTESTEGGFGDLSKDREVVVPGDKDTGVHSASPFLTMHPDLLGIRLKPGQQRRVLIASVPAEDWRDLDQFTVVADPPVKELAITRMNQLFGSEIGLLFEEPTSFDEDEYPIETTLRFAAMFKNQPEPRVIERRVVIAPAKRRKAKPKEELKDNPTYLRVTSRQPVKFVVGGPDVHVKLRWDGKDELVIGEGAKWTFQAQCVSGQSFPSMSFSAPNEGRLELLISLPDNLAVGDSLEFTVEAACPERSLPTSFVGQVIEPRKLPTPVPTGTQRKPPYNLKIVSRDDWSQETCWGATVWTQEDAGCFQEPTETAPLTLLINDDMQMLTDYRESMISKGFAEATIKERTTKYTTHVAFHLYQMHMAQKTRPADSSAENGDVPTPTDESMRQEIRRVSFTLLRLMDMR